jgi:hypothetical protein
MPHHVVLNSKLYMCGYMVTVTVTVTVAVAVRVT